MTERWQEEPWAQDLWWSGKTTRRRFLGLSAATAAALGATMLVPAPWREAFGQAKPYKIGIMQPLTGVAAAGGETAPVGSMMAGDPINKAGGGNRPPPQGGLTGHQGQPRRPRPEGEETARGGQGDPA